MSSGPSQDDNALPQAGKGQVRRTGAPGGASAWPCSGGALGPSLLAVGKLAALAPHSVPLGPRKRPCQGLEKQADPRSQRLDAVYEERALTPAVVLTSVRSFHRKRPARCLLWPNDSQRRQRYSGQNPPGSLRCRRSHWSPKEPTAWGRLLPFFFKGL